MIVYEFAECYDCHNVWRNIFFLGCYKYEKQCPNCESNNWGFITVAPPNRKETKE